jgi:hypothetical protein
VFGYVKAGNLKVSVPEIKFLFWPVYSNPMAVILIPTILYVKDLRTVVPEFLNSSELHKVKNKHFLCKVKQN